MSTKHTPEQFAKLPKWAQNYIRDLEMRRDAAIRQLKEVADTQTPSRISFNTNACTGENSGPTFRAGYVHPHVYEVNFRVGEKEYETVSVRLTDYSNTSHRPGKSVQISARDMRMSPVAGNCIEVWADDAP